MKSLTEESKWVLNSYEFGEVSFVSPTPDVAILAYTVTQTVTMDGQARTLQAAEFIDLGTRFGRLAPAAPTAKPFSD